MRTYTAKPQDINKEWLLIDAENLVLGRLAALIAKYLMGKHKPSYTSHMDMGDNVIVINVEKLAMTASKMTDKIYYRHTGYPGGIKSTTPMEILAGKHPERVLKMAVKRMLPKNKLARQQLRNLRLYAGQEHPHQAQNPRIIDIASKNTKNVGSKL